MTINFFFNKCVDNIHYIIIPTVSGYQSISYECFSCLLLGNKANVMVM